MRAPFSRKEAPCQVGLGSVAPGAAEQGCRVPSCAGDPGSGLWCLGLLPLANLQLPVGRQICRGGWIAHDSLLSFDGQEKAWSGLGRKNRCRFKGAYCLIAFFHCIFSDNYKHCKN
jgi:hypothetical protein